MEMSTNSSSESALRVHLEVFEGPLDLLLHLIRRQEVEIYDIPIAMVTDQYLQYLDMMKELNINVAAEFLVMAATLIHIKSKMLLPPDPAQTEEDEAESDPRSELVTQLLEYEKFKNAAGLLYERETIELSVWTRGMNEFAEEENEVVDVSVFDLVAAFHKIVERYRERIVLSVERDTVTLEQKLGELRRLLSVRRELLFSSFLEQNLSKNHLVMTLLALLEMVRLCEVRLFQKGLFEDIRIKAC